MKTYSLSTGFQKALLPLLYAVVAAIVETLAKELPKIPEIANWVGFGLVVVLLAMVGNWVKFRMRNPSPP